MSRFNIDKEALSIPWIESPFFYPLLDNSDLSEEEKDIVTKYHEDGYVIVDLGLADDHIDLIKRDVTSEIEGGEATYQPDGYHYSDSPRVFEAWKFSRAVLDLVRNEKLLSTLELLYGRKAIPFQTINFVKGTQQPLHSDSIHFYCKPEGWMAGTWTALEDVDELNGSLVYVPKSHKLPHVEFPDLNLDVPEYNEEISKYRIYEEYVDSVVNALGLTRKTLSMKKGQTIVWASRLFHGAIPIVDESRTRWSQATHYYFENCDYYYCPMYSNRLEGQYSEKNLSEKDILNHIV